MAELIDIVTLTTKLAAAYPNWRIDDFTNEIYFEDLRDIPTDLLKVAAQHCRTSTSRDQRFAPSAGEIRQAAMEIKRQAEGIPSALEAWAELLKVPKSEETSRITDEKDERGATIIEVTPYRWSHPLAQKVAYGMGFPKFPDWESESFERTAFLKAYQVELDRYMQSEAQPEDVKAYIEDLKANRPALGTVSGGIKQLAAQLEK